MTAIPLQPPPLPVAPTTGLVLTDADRQQLQQARIRRKRIDRALKVANFNGISAAALALLSAPFILMDPLTVVAVTVLAVVAFVELRGRSMVKKLQDTGLLLLAVNQAAFGIIIIAYACWQMFVALNHTDPHLAELASIGDMGKQIADVEQQLSVAVYGLLIPATIVFQGGMAWFYLHTRKALQQYIADTPQWVIDVLNAAG